MASLRLPHSGLLLGSASVSTQALDASNDAVGSIYIAPKTGTIDRIGVLITAKGGTAPTYRFGVEGVTTTRRADGTYKNGGNAYVDAADPAAAFAWRTLGATVSVTALDYVAATVRYQTGTIGASNYITVASRISAATNSLHPFAWMLTGGTDGTSAACPCVALRYDDGTVIGPSCPTTALTNNSWNSATSPLHRGTKFTPAVTCRCVGVWISARVGDAADFTVNVYAGSASSPIASTTVNPDEVLGSNANAYPLFIPLAPFTLTAGTVYRFVHTPTTGTSITLFAHAAFDSADGLAAYWGDLFGTTGVAGSPPTWTDYDNGTDGYRAYPIIPVIDDVTASSGVVGVIGG